ncbi:hypothetical protein SERLADRAFT_404552 [Serpula lacrymans var. lacrymans S7.9]|uniref:Uncharacterized protein n=1 Tax=Serpula lacrymans var. lacrymans (strain S7.9) TaxID=578457 RepID=F8NDP4_SERL9|nr:uncharacterized protein SERLADRAFT_404552 [Serpula lacrymans var. lacrymans S7.9]EGO30328.1 hypothetical protein SERLADRAFT_404552 [Serpula lacrymans var. lacrymans S7.9]
MQDYPEEGDGTMSQGRFYVDPERVIAPTSTFMQTFVKIQADPLEFSGFTDPSAHFATQMPNPLHTKSGGWLCGATWTPQETRNEILQQVDISLKSGGTEKVKNAGTNSGICDSTSASIVQQLLAQCKQLQKREAGKPALPESEVCQRLEQELETLLRGSMLDNNINPLLGMPAVVIHQDTPTEILHTVLLGVVKNFWGQIVWLLDKSHLLTTLQTQLESISKNGLNSVQLEAEYIYCFKGSLIGKHFKNLAQSVIGNLVVLLWHTKIDHTKKYLMSPITV